MSTNYVNSQVIPTTEVEVMTIPTRLTISDDIASYVAGMAENQASSLAQRVAELNDNNKVSGVSATFSMTDEHGRQITATASLSFTQ